MTETDVRARIRRIDDLREKAKKARALAHGYLGTTDVLTIDHSWTITRRFRSGLGKQDSLLLDPVEKESLRDWLSEKASEWTREADRLAETFRIEGAGLSEP